MQVLVIGGTGFIGPYVVRDLYDRGHEVTVFHRGEHESDVLPPVRHIRNPQANIPVLSFPADVFSTDFDVVIHMIAMGEADARAAVEAFCGRVRRIVALSSGDVYRAYGRFKGIEPGEIEWGLLTENSPLRSVLYPYRAQAHSPDELSYYYEKILVEKEVFANRELEGAILRLPKVYGPGQNEDLATVYAYRNRPNWRWTHGYVENVASAVVLAALHPAAANRIYNVGEAYTPTVAKRLRSIPPTPDKIELAADDTCDFGQDIVYDTTRIRLELGYTESIPYEEGLRRTCAGLAKARN